MSVHLRRRQTAEPTLRMERFFFRSFCLLHAGAAHALAAAAWIADKLVAPLPWSCRLGLLSTFFAVVGIGLYNRGLRWVQWLGEFTGDHVRLLRETGLEAQLERVLVLGLVFGVAQGVAALVAFIKRRQALRLLTISTTAFTVYWFWLFVYMVRIPSALMARDSELFDKLRRNDFWLQGFGFWLPVALALAGFLLCLALSRVHRFYSPDKLARIPVGDRIVSDLTTHGGDPQFRTSYYWSAFLHLSVIFLIPLFMRGCMEEPYGIPKGSGNPVVQAVKVKQVKQKKKEEMVLNMNSPILMYRPDLDDSKVFEELQEETMDTYVATSLQTGKLGKGGGNKGGWPNGMENARVRFIRLEYGGGDWDQQMGKGADYNMLIQFAKLTGFKIADTTEHIPVRQLRRFPKNYAPPFVFITGSKGISVTTADIKTLRWYCIEEGGLIFADNGGGHFDSSFKRLMRQVFPELDWVDIASDDIIFRQPYLFPSGAPPLWHHSGSRALGIKHNGRWVVFYHPGDMNDAWQNGHSGARPEIAMQAYRLGVNVINYAFTQYYDIHNK